MSIMMHKGSRSITREELSELETPEGTRTHVPIPHHEILNQTQKTLGQLGFLFEDSTQLVSNDNQRFLGSFTVDHPTRNWKENNDYTFKVAVMNSHDKTYPVTLFAGTEVFVCTNGQWSSNVKLSRKHTKNAWDDIFSNLRELAFQMEDIRNEAIDRFESLKEIDFDSKREVHDFVVETCKRNIIPWQHAPHVLEHWDTPEHDEFKDRNGYSLFNAYTSHWRSGNPFDLSSKTTRLRGFIDEFKDIGTVEPRHQIVRDLPQGLGESRL